jgi:hypothetical protein
MSPAELALAVAWLRRHAPDSIALRHFPEPPTNGATNMHGHKNPWVICTLCHGDGHVVNPAIDAGGISGEEMDADPDFREAYLAGAYDVPCNRCGGSGKVRAAELERLEREAVDRAADRRLEAAESGDVEAFLTAGDPRW